MISRREVLVKVVSSYVAVRRVRVAKAERREDILGATELDYMRSSFPSNVETVPLNQGFRSGS